jgi:hypothetical protein
MTANGNGNGNGPHARPKDKNYIMPCGYKSLGAEVALKLFLFIMLRLLVFVIFPSQKGNSYEI